MKLNLARLLDKGYEMMVGGSGGMHGCSVQGKNEKCGRDGCKTNRVFRVNQRFWLMLGSGRMNRKSFGELCAFCFVFNTENPKG